MAITAILDTPLSGLLVGAAQANAAAINFVIRKRQTNNPYRRFPCPWSLVALASSVRTQIPIESKPFDLRREFSGLIATEVAYDENVTIFRTADEHIDELINLTG